MTSVDSSTKVSWFETTLEAHCNTNLISHLKHLFALVSRERGKVYIINNTQFDFGTFAPRPRVGCESDRAAVTKAFKFVGYKEASITQYENQTAGQMMELMHEGEEGP